MCGCAACEVYSADLKVGRGVTILTLCLFGILCACVHGLAVVCIFAMFHVLCSRACVGRMKGTICQYVVYFLSSRLHCPSGLRRLFLLSSHKFLIDFPHTPHSAVVAWFLLGRLES